MCNVICAETVGKLVNIYLNILIVLYMLFIFYAENIDFNAIFNDKNNTFEAPVYVKKIILR